MFWGQQHVFWSHHRNSYRDKPKLSAPQPLLGDKLGGNILSASWATVLSTSHTRESTAEAATWVTMTRMAAHLVRSTCQSSSILFQQKHILQKLGSPPPKNGMPTHTQIQEFLDINSLYCKKRNREKLRRPTHHWLLGEIKLWHGMPYPQSPITPYQVHKAPNEWSNCVPGEGRRGSGSKDRCYKRLHSNKPDKFHVRNALKAPNLSSTPA